MYSFTKEAKYDIIKTAEQQYKFKIKGDIQL